MLKFHETAPFLLKLHANLESRHQSEIDKLQSEQKEGGRVSPENESSIDIQKFNELLKTEQAQVIDEQLSENDHYWTCDHFGTLRIAVNGVVQTLVER